MITRLLARVYAALLMVYPRAFREHNGAEMRALFAKRLTRARVDRGRLAAFVIAFREFADVVLTALREHRDAPPLITGARPQDSFMATLLRDLRYAARTLARTPLFTGVVVFTLALGIGANTAIFSVVNGVLLRPLPFDRPDRLAFVWEHNYVRGVERNVVSNGNYMDWKDMSQTFEDMAGFLPRGVNLTGSGDPDRIDATLITSNLFSVLGVSPAIGRSFSPEEGDPGNGEVVILGHGFWQQRFGGSTDVLGTDIMLNETPYTVVGVMPAEFDFPRGTAVWVPIVMDDWREREGRWMTVVGRMRGGVTLGQAHAEMARIGGQLEDAHADFNAGWTVNVVGMLDQVAGSVRPALLAMAGAVAFVLLIACANVANLLLGRGADGARSVAIRAALGASRTRLVRQFFTEAAVLATVAAILGLLLGIAGLRALVAAAPENLPRIGEVSIDGTVLMFTAAASIVTGLLFGVLPAVATSKTDVHLALKEGGRTNTGSRRARLRSGLVIAEVALAMMLLSGAGLLTRSFQRVMGVDTGMEVDRVLSGRIQLPGARYQTDAERIAFFAQLTERLDEMPGVVSASTISFLPLSGPGSATSFWVNDQPLPEPQDRPVADVRSVRPGYFRTMGIPLLEGRDFDGSEQPGADVRPIVINQWMAERHWPGQSAIGKTITMPWGDDLVGEVIGVAGNVRHAGPETEPRAKTYWAYSQFTWPWEYVAIRTEGDPASFAAAFREQAWALDPELPVSDVQTMANRMGTAVAERRFTVLLLGAFAGVAVLLACVGIYGVMSYTVSQRTHELGLRIALGAKPGRLLRSVVGRGLLLAGAAVGLGVAGSLAVSNLLASLVFQISPTDPVTLLATAALLGVVSMAACYVPALRAAKADPMVALRTD